MGHLYFVVQTMLMDPVNAGMTTELYKHLSHRVRLSEQKTEIGSSLDIVDAKVMDGRYFEALKTLRGCFVLEDATCSSDAGLKEEAA